MLLASSFVCMRVCLGIGVCLFSSTIWIFNELSAKDSSRENQVLAFKHERLIYFLPLPRAEAAALFKTFSLFLYATLNPFFGFVFFSQKTKFKWPQNNVEMFSHNNKSFEWAGFALILCIVLSLRYAKIRRNNNVRKRIRKRERERERKKKVRRKRMSLTLL